MRLIRMFGCFFIGLSLSLAASAGHHGEKKAKHSSWNLVSEQSKVAYGSIKKNSVGEVNHFTALSGQLSAAGEVKVTIDLNSVETHIGIRNQRMVKHVFGGDTGKAVLSTTIKPAFLDSLLPGEPKSIGVAGKLNYLGTVIDINTTMLVVKLSNSRIMAVTDEMIMVKTADLGVEPAIDKLMELAALSGITRVVPVTVRLVFDKK